MKVMPIVGVRPQIIKAAPVIHALMEDREIEMQLIHTGQHYDYEMSKAFFENFRLPDPLKSLGIGGGSHGWQTGMMIMEIEKVAAQLSPDLALVFGDANTALAGALAAVKLRIPVAHVEAGLRSYDLSMPEEINRIIADRCSQRLFAPTKTAVFNLVREGFQKKSIFLTGDTMVDILRQNMSAVEKSDILGKIDVEPKTYAVLTLHRVENVEDPRKLRQVVQALVELNEVPIVFPVHPRTRDRLKEAGLEQTLKHTAHMKTTMPLNYLDMLKLMKESKLVLTDSGGIQKEAFLLGVPCITLREKTEWIETVRLKANKLVGVEPSKITREARKILKDKHAKLRKLPNPFGDGKASEKIVRMLKTRF